MTYPNILIIDDHPIVAEGIKALLNSHHAQFEVKVTLTAAEALKTTQTWKPDVAIVDVSLPDMACARLIKLLSDTKPSIKIVVYTMHDEPWVVKELEKVKADAIVLKDDDIGELIVAIESVMVGIPFCSQRFKKLLVKDENTLTDRETEILQHLGTGLTSKEIGEKLFISENTVEYHRKKLMARLKANNTANLISIAMSKGFIHI